MPRPLQSQALGNSCFLTGATGFVGRFLLTQLLQQTEATLYCLLRAEARPQALLRLKAALAKWGLWRDQWSGGSSRSQATCGCRVSGSTRRLTTCCAITSTRSITAGPA